MAADEIFETKTEPTFLADSMLETSWAQPTRRKWTTLTSFGVQVLAIGGLLVLPLWRTVGFPALRMVSTPVMLGHRVAPEPSSRPRTSVATTAPNRSPVRRLLAPTQIPTIISAI